MREKLAERNGQRMRFYATVGRFGTKPRGNVRTILLRDVRLVTDTDEWVSDPDHEGKLKLRLDGEVVTDHLWWTAGQWAEGYKEGDLISFEARVDSYEKGYQGGRAGWDEAWSETDYHLERPTKVKLEHRPATEA
jgi:hypothetical protein